MAQAQAQAWWTEVEHLREQIEGRRQRRFVRADPDVPAQAGPEDALAHNPDASERRTRPVRPRRGDWEEGVRAHDGVRRDVPFAPRRTVRIRGQAIPTVTAPLLQVVDAPAPAPQAPDHDRPPPESASRPYASRRRPRAPAAHRMSANPDRLALWAFAFALLLLLVAALSAHGL